MRLQDAAFQRSHSTVEKALAAAAEQPQLFDKQ
jgi:hypothetical protein